MKKHSPKIDPCGTPRCTLPKLDVELLIARHSFAFRRYDLKKIKAWARKSYSSSLHIVNDTCSLLSKQLTNWATILATTIAVGRRFKTNLTTMQHLIEKIIILLETKPCKDSVCPLKSRLKSARVVKLLYLLDTEYNMLSKFCKKISTLISGNL